MNQPKNAKQSAESKDHTIGYNEILSEKARASVAASTVLLLSSSGLIELTQLPFIGAALKPSQGDTLTWLLCFSAVYFGFRFSVYKRSVELSSQSEDLSLRYAKLYLRWWGGNYLKDAKSYLLENGRIDGFRNEKISPAEHQMGSINRGTFIWSNYDLTEWSLGKAAFDEFEWEDSIFRTVYPNSIIHVPKTFTFTSNYELKQGNILTNDVQLGGGTIIHQVSMSSKHYRTLEFVCKHLAKLLLPDFLEMTLPKILLVVSLSIAAFNLFDSTPEAKPKTSCEAAASTMVKVCT